MLLLLDGKADVAMQEVLAGKMAERVGPCLCQRNSRHSMLTMSGWSESGSLVYRSQGQRRNASQSRLSVCRAFHRARHPLAG